MFIETICIMQGEVQNKLAHEDRMQRTATHFGFKAPLIPDLKKQLPIELHTGKVKCRIIYYKTIEDISFQLYIAKKITSLKVMEASVDYSFKFADRKMLDTLSAQKDKCDEILICRNGFISDTSYSNVVLTQNGQYFTPPNPLLYGTKRQKLINERVIQERNIHYNTLTEYDGIYLINAMLDIDDNIYIPVNNIMY